jgi:RNA polymerase sigma-70 factor (ECF subfamily)
MSELARPSERYGAGEVDALDSEQLLRIERALHGKLRASRLSETFIARHGEDAVQQGLAEYASARARGRRIEDPGAWVVSAAFQRAIDALRREVREADDPKVIEAALASTPAPGPTPEEVILERAETERLHEAIAKLSPEQRQALSLYYFEERTTREGAQTLHCSEPTFRRRLNSALNVLRERFGIAVPEPGDRLAVEIGLAAWVSLAGARVVPARGLLDQLIAAADALRGGVVGAGRRARDLLSRLLASGGGEGAGAVASGPLGKAVGVCTGALAVCVAAWLFGHHDLGGGTHVGSPPHNRASVVRPAPAAPLPLVARTTEPQTSATAGTSSPAPAQHRSAPTEATAAQKSHQADRAANSQLGVESAAPEASSASPPAPEVSEPSSSSPSAPSSTPSPTEAANGQFAP